MNWEGGNFMKRIGIISMVTVFFFFPVAAALAQVQPIQFKNLDAPPSKIQPTRIIKRAPVPAQIKPGTVKINKLQPIQFKPFVLAELRHPKTHPTKAGQPILPDEEITITQKISGEVKTFKIKGRDLLNEINKLEQKYNALGYTIRRPVKTPIVINESIMKQDLLQRQRQDSLRKFRPLTQAVRAPKFATMQAKFAQDLNRMPSIVSELNRIQSSLPDAIPQPINRMETYDDYWGDRDFFAAGIHGRVSLYADKDKMKASAEGRATAVVFNREFTVVSITGNSEAPTANANGQMSASLKVTALGDDLFAPISLSKTGSLKIEDDEGITVDESVKIPVVELGPFSLNVTLGFHGQAGIRYGVYLTPTSLQARFMPYLETSAYGQVGLNVWVIVSIEAGVGARLTLLNDYLPLSIIAGIGFDQSPPYFYYEYYVQNTFEALSGEVYVYVTVDYYIDSDTWKWTIFSWGGFHYDGYVIGPAGYNVAIRPKEEPDAWTVTVYEHANYGGKSKTFTINPGRCQDMEVYLAGIGWNDKISSVKVGKNVAVFLFEHEGYSGGYKRLDASSTYVGKDFNDKASSIIVFPKAMGYPVGVWLTGNHSAFRYVHDPDHYNNCSCKTGVTHHPKIPYNDDATRVIIPRINPQSPPWGYIEVELFEHESYQGRSVKFRAGPEGREFTLPPELSKKVSSLRIFLRVNEPNRLQRSW